MSSRGSCARNAVFYHTNDAAESKIARETRCFTIETAVGGREGRRCQTAVSVMFAYARLWSPMLAYGRIGPPLGSVIAGCQTYCNGGFQVALGC